MTIKIPDCLECSRQLRLKRSRRLVTVAKCNLFRAWRDALGRVARIPAIDRAHGPSPGHCKTIVREVDTRLELLIAIGLDYLNLNRRSSTLSGGEDQRIRLSSAGRVGIDGDAVCTRRTQHRAVPKDNVKMIETLKRLRDPEQLAVIIVERGKPGHGRARIK